MNPVKQLIVIMHLAAPLLIIGQTHAANNNTETAQLETIVVTPTLTPVNIELSPGSIQVIDSEEIRQLGAQTLAEALSQAVGLDIDSVSGRGRIPQIRGLTNKRVLILLDGMRFATGFRDTSLDLTEFPVEIIDRIEIVRGPTSALYGSEAVGGVINIITRAPAKEFSGSGTLQHGMNKDGEAGNTIIKGFLGNTWGRLGVSLAQHINLGEKYDRVDADNFSDFDDEVRHSGMLNLNYQLDDNHRVSSGLFYSHTNRQGIRPKFGLRWDRESDSDRVSTFIKYDGKINDTTIMARAYYSNFDSDRSYTDIGAPYTNQRQIDRAQREPDQEDFSIKNELTQLELQANHLFANSHLVTFGLEHREEQRDGVENRGEDTIDKTVDNQAVFVQDSFSLSDKLNITAGLRLDRHSDFGSELSPRLNLISFFTDNIRAKASYGEGFRAPTVYELYATTSNRRGDVLANADLQPETAKSYELGLVAQSERLHGTITLFRNELENMIDRKPTGNSRMSGNREILEYVRFNIGEAYTQGLELEGNTELSRSFSLTGNFTYIDAENRDTGETLAGVPDTRASLRFAYDNPATGWHANLRVNHIGEQVVTTAISTHTYQLWNLYLEKSFKQKISLHAGIDNIFDEIPEFASNRGVFIYTGITARF